MQDLPAIERNARSLLAARRYEDAEAVLRPHLASGSGPLVLWGLLASAIKPLGKITEVRAIQEMLVENGPGNFPVRFDLAETLLLQGEFERGWRA